MAEIIYPTQTTPSYLRTSTQVVQNGASIAIKTRYVTDDGAAIIECFIAQGTGNSNGTSYKAGELIIVFADASPSLVATINNRGELILTGTDVDRYTINSEGYLIYT